MDVSKLAVHLGLLAMAAAGPVVAQALVDNATALGVTGVWLALVREFDKGIVEPWFASLYKLDPTLPYTPSHVTDDAATEA